MNMEEYNKILEGLQNTNNIRKNVEITRAKSIDFETTKILLKFLTPPKI